jgi:two-component system, chemotaxis family, CheB/CheR fusion protein
MYLNAEAQSRILARFHFALTTGGVLFLGKAEMLLSQSHLFTPIDLRRRIFRKVSKDSWRDRMAIMNQASSDQAIDPASEDPGLAAGAFDTSPHAQFIVNRDGLLAACNECGRALFGLTDADLGRPLQDLEVSYRPVELRSLLAQLFEHGRALQVRDVQWDRAGNEPRYFDVHIASVGGQAAPPVAASVTFVDVGRVHDLQLQLNRSKQDLETAYEELQSTNEEPETTNEELQSTNEELEAERSPLSADSGDEEVQPREPQHQDPS